MHGRLRARGIGRLRASASAVRAQVTGDEWNFETTPGRGLSVVSARRPLWVVLAAAVVESMAYLAQTDASGTSAVDWSSPVTGRSCNGLGAVLGADCHSREPRGRQR